MKFSPTGFEICKAFEDCLEPVKGTPGHFKAYRDPVGVLTIGWGSTNEAANRFGPSTIWTQQQCDDALAADMVRFEKYVASLCHVAVTQNQFDVLVDWSYNTGGPHWATVWRSLNSGKYHEIPALLMQWDHGEVNGRSVELAGLKRRRHSEALLWQGRTADALTVAKQTPGWEDIA